MTAYRFKEPEAAWLSLKTAVSSQVDALSAIVFSTLLKSSLLSYGIDEPENFLPATTGEMLTLRLDAEAERSILVVGVEIGQCYEICSERRCPLCALQSNVELFEDSAGDIAAGLTNDFLVVGPPSEVQQYLALRKAGTVLSAEKQKQLTFYCSPASNANVVTFTNDESRVVNFFSTVMAARGSTTPTASIFKVRLPRFLIR